LCDLVLVYASCVVHGAEQVDGVPFGRLDHNILHRLCSGCVVTPTDIVAHTFTVS
jgi:hypothetical protein